ncbi:MAG: glycosyltransferase family 2 protein [Flavobacteriaceae bacterium]|jgi:glycosyltransferase involved in cell wall biosynthesis|nr:glycosyltransferase family 2 protein [Flavobacteriaceae bacterium]
MNKNPLFSILVANYNNGRYFKECYESIIRQTYQNFEVIIVDDGSEDNSVELIENIIAENPKFKLYQNEKNYGCGYTKRRCAELATGEICGFLDPDDALVSDALEIMADAHLKNPDKGHIYSNLIYCDENLNKIKIKKNEPIENRNPYYYNLDHKVNALSTFKKSDYLKTEGINPYMRRAIDMDLYFKLYEVTDTLYIDCDLYIYRIHSGGISTLENTNKANFWHWFAIMKAAERRNVNVENLFLENFYRKNEAEEYYKALHLLKKSRLIKLFQTFGFLKWLNKIK